MLSILGIVAVVVFAIQVYKSASSTGRNAPLWTIITVAIGVVVQFVIPMFIGLVFGIYIAAVGGDVGEIATSYVGIFTIIGIVSIVVSIIGMWLVSKHVSKITDDGTSYQAPPPPPPAFGQ